MEKEVESNERLLIDFSSPASKNVYSPLIPVPLVTTLADQQLESNTPFDVLDPSSSPDPFEKVFKNAFFEPSDSPDERKAPCLSEEIHGSSGNKGTESETNEKDYSPIITDGVDSVTHESHENKIPDDITQKTESKFSINNKPPITNDVLVAMSPENTEKSCSSEIPTVINKNSVRKPTDSKTDSAVPDTVTSGSNEQSCNSENPVNSKQEENSICISPIKSETDILKNKSNTLLLPEGDSHNQISTDFSTEESLKAVIAKRVNKCIQKVLSNSFKSKNIKCNHKENNAKHSLGLYRRSLSFVKSSSPAHKTVCDRLNKSCSYNESFNLENQELMISGSSSDTSDFRPISPLSSEVSKSDNSETIPEQEDQVFKEAKKLARTFSKIAESFCHNSDSEDDLLMNCNPKWLYTESSEDEEEKLRRDPALNFRRSFNSSLTQSSPTLQSMGHNDSPALAAYKKRRSLEHLKVNTSLETNCLRRSNSVEFKPSAAPVIPTIVASAPIVLPKPDENPIRLKKKITGDLKKGPMKAVIPVQSMTKESLPQEVKIIANRETSPIRKQSSFQVMETPDRENSQLGMKPVASSTPNKVEQLTNSVGKCSLLKPPIEVPLNKRHSLESKIESRKSRNPSADAGPRQRSNSASSNIPTPVTHLKASKDQRLMKSTFKPKSTSNLISTSAVKTELKIQQNNVSTKQMKSSFNPRALSEVKPKSVGQGRVKTAMNTISSLVKGKGKKAVTRDKENRVPT